MDGTIMLKYTVAKITNIVIRILHLFLNAFGYILDQIQINLVTANMESPYKNISEQILKGL